MLKVQSRPLVAVIGDHNLDDKNRPHIQARLSYLLALSDLCDVQPIILPPLPNPEETRTGFINILDSIDGVLLTGNQSHLQPRLYGQNPEEADALFDPLRDNVILSGLSQIIRAGIPLLGICRGMQEINVLYGGTLHQKIHEVSGKLYHRWTDGALDVDNYAPRHNLKVQTGGVLETILSTEEIYLINSVHSQAIDQLGEGLYIEGLAEDGVIEAISIADSPGFAVGVQWHPEWERVREFIPNKPIFSAFSQAVYIYHERRINHHVE